MPAAHGQCHRAEHQQCGKRDQQFGEARHPGADRPTHEHVGDHQQANQQEHRCPRPVQQHSQQRDRRCRLSGDSQEDPDTVGHRDEWPDRIAEGADQELRQRFDVDAPQGRGEQSCQHHATDTRAQREPPGRHAINERRLRGTNGGGPTHQRADNNARNHGPAGAPPGHGEFAGGPHAPTRYQRDQGNEEGDKHHAQQHSVSHFTDPCLRSSPHAPRYLTGHPESMSLGSTVRFSRRRSRAHRFVLVPPIVSYAAQSGMAERPLSTARPGPANRSRLAGPFF